MSLAANLNKGALKIGLFIIHKLYLPFLHFFLLHIRIVERAHILKANRERGGGEVKESWGLGHWVAMVGLWGIENSSITRRNYLCARCCIELPEQCWHRYKTVMEWLMLCLVGGVGWMRIGRTHFSWCLIWRWIGWDGPFRGIFMLNPNPGSSRLAKWYQPSRPTWTTRSSKSVGSSRRPPAHRSPHLMFHTWMLPWRRIKVCVLMYSLMYSKPFAHR